MHVSIIIPVYNEEDVILECLESLLGQTQRDLEIIVVDDGSTDNSKVKIQNAKLQLKIQNLKILTQKHRGPGPARNLGVKHAKGEILVFVDADMTFAPDFVGKLIQPIEEGESRGTFSKLEYVKNSENVWAQCWGVNEGWVKGMRHPKDYPDKQKVFRAVLKSEFERVGGFSPTGEYTDDWTLSEKLGYLAESAPGAVFYHKNPDSLEDVFFQAKWIGKRQYKLGKVGTTVSIVRSSFPISLVWGMVKAVENKLPQFVVFKIVYDFGIFSGAFLSFIGGSNAK
ncbi:MAG: glycosyltransferase family 2 protein [Candidatus Blackburnbacteria bacterium]|nr:glycosyltransferase family 2 protein [Candidatus Blackburnbacteria bacterium]